MVGVRHIPRIYHPLWRVRHRRAFDFLKQLLREGHTWVPDKSIKMVGMAPAFAVLPRMFSSILSG